MSRQVLVFAAAVSLLIGLVPIIHAQSTFTLRVDSTAYFYGEWCYVINFIEDTTVFHTKWMYVEDDTIYQLGYQDPGSPPVYELKIAAPMYLTVGTQWVSQYGPNPGIHSVQELLTVIVPADTFEAYEIEIHDSLTGEYYGYYMISQGFGRVSSMEIWEGDTTANVLESFNIIGGTGAVPLAVGNEWNYIEGYQDTLGIGNIHLQSNLLSSFSLHPNHPNPFNPSTVLSFELRAASFVRLEVFNGAGSWITTLEEGWKTAGVHEVIFDGSGLPSGMYLARLTARDYTAVQKLVLLK